MKSLIFRLIAVFFFVTFASSAQSRDWTGGFIGLHGGYAWQDGFLRYDSDGAQSGPNGPNFDLEFDEGIIGGQGGYLIQTGNFVFGIVGDYTAGRDDDVVNDPASGDPEFVTLDAKYLASVRGELGYAFGNVLVYGTVGIGFTEYEISVRDPDGSPSFGSLDSSEEGAVYGGGVRIKVGDGVSIGAEYLHYDVGTTINIPDDNVSGLNDADDGDFLKPDDVDVIRATVNIHFGARREAAPLK